MKSSLTASRVQPWKVNRGRHLLIAPGTLAAEARYRLRHTLATQADLRGIASAASFGSRENVVAVAIWAFAWRRRCRSGFTRHAF